MVILFLNDNEKKVIFVDEYIKYNKFAIKSQWSATKIKFLSVESGDQCHCDLHTFKTHTCVGLGTTEPSLQEFIKEAALVPP